MKITIIVFHFISAEGTVPTMWRTLLERSSI